MNKTTLLIVFLFLVKIVSAQSDAICVYKVSLNQDSLQIKESDDEINKGAKNLLRDALELAKDFNYTLKFNTSESIFYLDELMINEAMENSYLYPIAKALVGKGIYYQNKIKDESLQQTETMGELFIIKDILLNNWNITEEQKKIGKYTCFKAERICKSCNTADEVWFTPEIPVPYGPIGYGGLPGLIIEVRKKIFTLRLISISFESSEVKINEPKDGKTVSKDEYKEITSGFRNKIIKRTN